MRLTELQRAGPLSDGQVVTLLVGLGLELAALHRLGRCHGSLHPAHVEVDAGGRPHLRSCQAAYQWSVRDDLVALLRLGKSLARPASAFSTSLRERAQAREFDTPELIAWIFQSAAPQPLPTTGLTEDPTAEVKRLSWPRQQRGTHSRIKPVNEERTRRGRVGG